MKILNFKQVILCLLAILIFIPLSSATSLELKGISLTNVTEQQMVNIKAGISASNQDRQVVANKIFLEMTKETPNVPFGWIGLSLSATSLEQFDQAISQAKALRKNANDAEKLLIDIQETYLTNNSEKRLELTDTMVKKFPASSLAWETRGHALSKVNQNEKAREAFLQASNVAPYEIESYLAAGTNYLFNSPKDFTAAEKQFSKVIELQPANFWGHINLGDVHRAQQNLTAALKDYTRAVWLAPSEGTGFTKRGHVNTFLGNYEVARNDYQRATQVADPIDANYLANYQTFTHLYENQPKKSLQELAEVMSIIDKSPIEQHDKTQAKIFTLQNMAMIGLHHQLLDSAQQSVKQREALINQQLAVVKDEDINRVLRAENQYWQGFLQAQSGRLSNANDTADKMKALLTPIKNARKLEDYHELMALISLKKEQWGEAVKHYQQADKEKVYVKFHQAVALEQTGDKKQAQRLFEEVSNYNFNSVEFALLRDEATRRSQFVSVAVTAAK